MVQPARLFEWASRGHSVARAVALGLREQQVAGGPPSGSAVFADDCQHHAAAF